MSDDSPFIPMPPAAVYESEHWFVLVSWQQHTLGTLLIVHKENIPRWSQISPEAAVDFLGVQKHVELVLDENFSPDHYNYIQAGNVTSHLHFHVIPRYKDVRNFAGHKFADKSFGDSFTETPLKAPQEVLDALAELFN